jgi:hypothetical protein
MHQFNVERMILVRHGFIEYQIAIGRRHQLYTGIFPNESRRQLLVLKIALDGVMAEVRVMCRVVCQRVVDLARQKELT